MILDLLRRMGLAPPVPTAMDDQTYAEAAMENAVIDSSRSICAISEVAKAGGMANAKLQAGIDRMKISGTDACETMARASRRRIHN